MRKLKSDQAPVKQEFPLMKHELGIAVVEHLPRERACARRGT